MSGVLENLSTALAETVEAVSPSVVRVEARRRLPASGVVWSSDGVIVTSHHIVETEEGIQIGLDDGSVVEANLVGRDPSTDLAVLRVEDGELAAPTWSDLDAVQVGHLVLATARPGEQIQATLGIVSAVGEVVEARSRGRRRGRPGGPGRGPRRPGGRGRHHGPRGKHSKHGPGGPHRHAEHHSTLDNVIQTDVLMYPGFSGGALVNAAGQVLGINTSVLRGTSLTIPTPTIRRVTEMLLQHGRVRRGYLGVTTQPVTLPAALQESLDQETGLLVIAVEPDSPADKGGIVLGDTLVTLEGNPISTIDNLLSLLTGDLIGSSVSIGIIRAGEAMELGVEIGERP